MELSKENILRSTDKGLSVFRHYIGKPFQIGKNFLNPLYEDKHPSCNVYFDRRHDCYRLKDFGNDDYSGDCFAFVGKISGLTCSLSKDFIQIMEKINEDLHLGLGTDHTVKRPIYSRTNLSCSEIVTKERTFSIQQKSFSASELSWWKEYGITETILMKYNVISLKRFDSVSKESRPFYFVSSEQEPLYGYLGQQRIKIYRPKSSIRFVQAGKCSDSYCFGLEMLPAKGDLLFITGGEKDVLTLAAHGFNGICFNSETSNIPLDIIHNLSYRFKHIILLFDVDETGIKCAQKQEQNLRSYGIKRLHLPLAGIKEEKDVSDYFRAGYTHDDLMRLFLDYLDTLYNETMAALKSCEVDLKNPPPVAQIVVSVNDVPLGTQGNLFCITGGEGTGKSNYVAALIAGAIGKQEEKIDTLGMSIQRNSNGTAILFYDTEQSEMQLYKNIDTLLRRAKQEVMPGHFHAYSLTGISRKERLQAIIQSMDKFYYQCRGIQMVVIDGIADLIKCANDEAESVAVVEELYRLAGIYNTCIITVLHFIPNGLKLRGHLGSELQRKAAAILSIERDNDQEQSVVKALKVRDGSPLDVPLMLFSWNKEAAMHIYTGEKSTEAKEKRKENDLTMVAKDVFSRKRFLTYAELSESIQLSLDVKERTAKNYIRFMREKEIILKDPSNQNYFIIGLI